MKNVLTECNELKTKSIVICDKFKSHICCHSHTRAAAEYLNLN